MKRHRIFLLLPLYWMLLHHKVTPELNRKYPFIHLNEEKHCESKVLCPRTQRSASDRVKPSPPRPESSALTTRLQIKYALSKTQIRYDLTENFAQIIMRKLYQLFFLSNHYTSCKVLHHFVLPQMIVNEIHCKRLQTWWNYKCYQWILSTYSIL